MYQVQSMAAETFAAFETILALALLYWLMVELVARLGRVAELRATAFLRAA
jgi:polar amino acid transport system permease protein